ncbi:hypothetical protein PF006_g5947 [Phytophthora fragariae]|uniref:IPT/TIG domain-containing protein n=1 Tax=Phytophthora fragariae TaxID=53985 RepID=A0A6A3UDS3_9STRA|nr:hypothetical protein PF006_g5947 [Phytophthora fragariae]
MFCPLGTANTSSIYINCPSDTWSSSSQDELMDCFIRPVPICDKLAEKQYYPQFTYTFQGSPVNFDSTVETSRTGEVEVVDIIYPVNESASVQFWKNDTVDTIRVCPPQLSTNGGVLLTVIGRNFQDTGRLVCKFQLPKSTFSQISPAFFVSSTRVTCRAPPLVGNDTAATGSSFSQTVQVSVSNYGVHFSTTSASFKYISIKAATSLNMKQLMATCLKRVEVEEGFRDDDKAWFALTGLGEAKLSFDFRHLPDDLVYDEHYKIAIFVKNSSCEDQTCDSRGVVLPSGPNIETSPCRRPVELPRWFLSTAVDKNDLLNITLLALEDITFKLEIHIMYGLYASVAPFFVNSTAVKLKTPSRSNVTQGVTADTRPLSRSISYEGELIPRDYTFLVAYFGGNGDYTSPPLNLPPKYKAYERGRVLLSHNVSSDASEIPLVVDPYADVVTDTSYWLMPYGSASLTHEYVEKYRETFQEMYLDATGTQYLFRFDKMLLSYLPFQSNCMEYDSYMPLFDLLESDSCQLPAMTSETGSYGRTWWRREFPPLPNQDDIRHVGPFDVAQEPTADICMMDIQCHYEENLPTADVTPRWFEQSSGTVLYYLLREPATLADYLRGGKYYDEILDQLGFDYFIPVTVDNSAAALLEGDCSTLCFPRSVTLDIAYYQLDDHVKRIIMATLVYDHYDRDSTNTAYTFSVNLNPLNYFGLVIQFAFEKQVFVGLFFVLGSMMTVGALIFWIVVRITSILQSPPRFRFWAVFALISPPPCEVMLPIQYNIREKDMEIYLWYSLIILFFQLVIEVFVLNVVEIFQGWKLYDYLVYCRYRFLQREKRWKGLEPNLDECIDEGLRTLDQMCFSSQFFMMCTIHITGIVFFVVGIEIMARASYNMFGDPAMPLLLAFVLAASIFIRSLALFLAVKFEVWKIKHENTAWLAPPDEDDEFGVPRWDELEKIKGASHEAYLMNQRITSETFRNKFLNYNRTWLVNQLPSILTPRTLRRARPYLLAQFAKILDSLNPQVSDDDEDEDGRPRFGPVTLSAPSRTIIRLWLARARRILRLKTVVQPLIQQARKSECEMCLSRRQLQVEMAIPIEVLGDKFDSQTLAEEFDAAAWKDFFAKHQKFKTLCLNCIVHLKTTGQIGGLRGLGGGAGGTGGDEGWGATPLNAASYALLQKWYRKAQDRVFGKSGKRHQQLDVSDDEEEAMQHRYEWTRQPVALNAASTALARKWLIAARQKLREPGRVRDQLPTNLTAIHPTVRGGATPVPKPAMKKGAAGGEAVKASKMRRK